MSEIRKVTLYKIKPKTNFEDFLKPDLDDCDHIVNEEHGFEGYIKFVPAGGAEKSDEQIPWLIFLNSGFGEKKYAFVTRNRFPRAVMALKITVEGGDPIFYAATFGQHGDSFLDKSRIVHDFGIKVGMNICDIDRLRRVQTTMHESISKQTERQASVGASLNVFGINTESEFLRTISGNVRPEYAQIVESFKGKDSIAIKLPKDRKLSWGDMAETCRKLEERYNSTDYRDTEFKVYDILRHENDPETINALDSKLCGKIKAKDFSKIHLAPPEFIEGDEFSYCYRPKEGENIPQAYDDLRIEDLVEQPRRHLKNLTTSTLKNWAIYKLDHEHENTFPLWNAYQCIVAEIELDNRTFVLVNGQWREVSQQLKERVTSYFQEHDLVLDVPYLPADVLIYDETREQNREEVYNHAIAAAEPRVFLFDKAKIEIAGKRLYEVCDLMHADKHFIHVKKYSSGAASISHIFTQTKFYSHAFSTDEDTRKSIIDWINENKLEVNAPKEKELFCAAVPEKSSDVNESDYTVIFCILHDTGGFELTDLPFMSQYELMLSHRFLTQDRRFKVGVVFRRITLGPQVH